MTACWPRPRSLPAPEGTAGDGGPRKDLVSTVEDTIYHPQTDRLVEHFNQTLKQMLRRLVAMDKRDWDLMIPYVFSGIREVPQASTGFTPFELLFGRQPRGPSCSSSRGGYISHASPATRRDFFMRLSTNSLSDLSHRKQRMTNQAHWSTARSHCTGIEKREHSRHRNTHEGLYLSPYLSTLPLLVDKIHPPGHFPGQSWSCDSSSRDSIYKHLRWHKGWGGGEKTP